MADRQHLSNDLAWYQDRWEELMDLLPASDPEHVVDQVRELQVSVLDDEAQALDDMGLADANEAKSVLRRIFERMQHLRRENQELKRAQEAVGAEDPSEFADAVESLQAQLDALQEQQAQLSEAGFKQPVHVLKALRSANEQLEALYEEKEATEASDADTELRMEGDTFDQLQALLAREEKLQRELGVSSPDAVIEMVEGLSDQLDELYQERDADASADSIFSPAAPSSQSDEGTLEQEFGVSDPAAISTMVENLTDQLDELYSDREHFTELNLNGAEDAVEMVKNMQLQLESLYERREELSQYGIRGIGHALSLIDSMGEQLSELYDERHELATEKGIPNPEEAASRLDELEEELSALLEEKKTLREKRDRLETQLNTLRDELGLDDPEAIPDLVQSLEDQLQETYAQREAETPSSFAPDASLPLLDEETRTRLDTLDDDALAALSLGIFRLDAEGAIQYASPKALQWPDATGESPEALVGQNFFSDVAPGTNNTLFRGRFTDGIQNGEMDDQFTYTYVSRGAPPTNLMIHLYSSPDSSAHWLAFMVLEQY